MQHRDTIKESFNIDIPQKNWQRKINGENGLLRLKT